MADGDRAIVDWVDANGHPWQKLAAAFPQFVPGAAKRLSVFLFQQKLNDEWEQAREVYDLEVAEVYPNTGAGRRGRRGGAGR
jgi:hypothetical protein